MPNFTKIVESSSASSSSVVIVNELGPLGSHLADSLLELGCQVFYLGDKKKDQIDYLQGRSNFQILKNFSQIQELTNPTYFFYLTNHLVNKNKLLATVGKICQEKKVKLLITTKGEEEFAQQVLEKLIKGGGDARICFFQEIYGPRIKEGKVFNIIRSAYFEERISLPMEGNFEINLIYYFDFIKGIIRAMFGPETNGKLFDIGGEKFSLIALVNELKEKLSREVKIEFGKGKSKKEETADFKKANFDFGWQPETSLSEGIKETLFWLEKKEGEAVPAIPVKKEATLVEALKPGHFQKKIIFGFFAFLFLIFTLFVIPIILFLFGFSLARKDFQSVKKEWLAGDLPAVKLSLRKTAEKIDFSKRVFDLSAPFYEVFGFGDGVREVEPILTFSSKGISSLRSLAEIEELLSPSISALIKGEKTDFSPKISEVNNLLDKIYTDASLLWTSFEDKRFDKRITQILKVEEILSSTEAILPDFRKEVSRLRLLLPNVSEIIAEKGRRSYLVLCQNNQELRPTGGFIGSVLILTFQEGKLIDFEVKSTQELDKLLKGQVEPPKKLKEYYGETNWSLKNANWEPDFPVSAKKIEWFFTKETGRVIDGVMATNLNFAKKLLEATGEITLANSEEKINSQNLFEKSAYFEKPEFLGDLFKAIFERAKTSDEFKLIKIVGAIYSSLTEKEVLFYFKQAQINSFLKNFNWDGSFQDNLACQKISDRCLGDYLMINEANLGANKTNYFLKRMVSHQVEILDEGKLAETLKIYYQNLSLTEAWPGGRYKNYLRLYLPAKTELESIMVNDPAEANYWLQIPPAKIEVATESGRMVFGVLIEVPIKSGRVVEIKYSPPFSLDLSKTFTYTSLVQKQSGMGETPLSLMINYPSPIKPLKILPKGTLAKEQILINDQLDKDKIFRVDFGK